MNARLIKPALVVGFATALLTLGAAPRDGRTAGSPPPSSAVTAEPRAAVLANRPVPPITSDLKERVGSGTGVKVAEPSISAPASSSDLLAPPEPVQVISALRMAAPLLIMLLPAAVLMFTAFVRINIVLILLRQALGSPQVPGNQVLSALALLLTALVMRPVAEVAYTKGIEPYASGHLPAVAAWEAGTKPIKAFMIKQIERTNHEDYLWQLYDLSATGSANRPDPVSGEDFPLQVVAPAFLLSELTTALVIGFYIYLPFLVIDLVVSSVLAAMGLFMLPPSLIAMPLKLILFVLADGWMLVATMLLQSFAS
ncbi:flagellar type III secretion system pore protein FliP [Singulisphaera acidiphila]|uniref:Flagellar biosynthesis pathway, component FliP n=1 Tax=Singulisphaera acidiphila (strain ATCC BAA-1392 / DSM 18658 / VKM B-2454 / MOB10) TaxID=886293 RepID=L0DR26_SINAD|nr:flagellar type III secretion system pore protein FliP [Singulisphaera acidiphila]AGA31455.1 flagellar biosynthesis pathway, component FliP [Singulisphaera acidiphila DSM 18658]